MPRTPKAPPQDKSPPTVQSTRQLALFRDPQFPRRQPIYDRTVLLQAWYQVRNDYFRPKSPAKAGAKSGGQDGQLALRLKA